MTTDPRMADDLNHTMQMVKTLNEAVRKQEKTIAEQANEINELKQNHVTLAFLIRDIADQTDNILQMMNRVAGEHRIMVDQVYEVREKLGLVKEEERAAKNSKKFFDENFDPDAVVETLKRMGEAIKDPPDAE